MNFQYRHKRILVLFFLILVLCPASLGCVLPKLPKGSLWVSVSFKEAHRALPHVALECAMGLLVVPAALKTESFSGRHGRRLILIGKQARLRG